jgi:3-methyladenine DNA glycosylase AlkD
VICFETIRRNTACLGVILPYDYATTLEHRDGITNGDEDRYAHPVRGMIISREEINTITGQVKKSTLEGDHKAVIATLKTILDGECPFQKLDLLGRQIGEAASGSPGRLVQTLDRIIDYNAMGGFVIVGQALISLLGNDFDQVMEKSREYIAKGDKWYVTDIIGERSIGQALVDHFDRTIPWLSRFLDDENRWVKRSAGVAIHFFSKRVVNEPGKTRRLLDLIEPHIEEKQVDVVKGIGWGLKTIGKHHPDILVQFLPNQFKAKRKISRHMIRKATTYLNKDKRKVIESHVQGL